MDIQPSSARALSLCSPLAASMKFQSCAMLRWTIAIQKQTACTICWVLVVRGVDRLYHEILLRYGKASRVAEEANQLPVIAPHSNGRNRQRRRLELKPAPPLLPFARQRDMETYGP
jgi:hypothetical protein